jgi:tight adherence protein B
MAIRIQREVGGNLAEILTTVAATLRERERLRRQVQVLSAEGRLSAWILGALPPVFTLYLIVSRPDYLRPLVTQPLGWLLVITGATLLTVGVLWMRKAVKVEV